VKNILAGNLDFALTAESIRSLFQPYEAIERASVATDRDTGGSKGFAFVEVTDPAEADREHLLKTRPASLWRGSPHQPVL